MTSWALGLAGMCSRLVQELHDMALTEPDIAVHHMMMPFSLARLVEIHTAGSIMLGAGRAEPNPAASDFEQYQAASAAHWIGTYYLTANKPVWVGTAVIYSSKADCTQQMQQQQPFKMSYLQRYTCREVCRLGRGFGML